MFISIAAFEPLWNTPTLKVVNDNIAESAGDYTHTISAFGGFDTASFTFQVNQPEAESWFTDGLGRHILVTDRAGDVVWEGFADQIDLTAGSRQQPRGPLVDVVNDLAVEFSGITFDTNPPTKIPGGITTFAADSNSQDRYGTLQGIVNGGEGTTSDAEKIRDTLLARGFANPSGDATIATTSGGGSSITINCKGYYHLLAKYIYNYTTSANNISISDKIKAIISADPDSRFPTTFANVKNNTYQVNEWEDKNRDALTIIKGLVPIGDTSDNRWLFGVYEDQDIYFAPVPSDVEYLQSLVDNRQDIRLFSEKIVEPWNVRPGKFLINSSFLVDTPLPVTDLANDDRVVFIESVTYNYPYSISLREGNASTIGQALAKLGLGGIT